MERGKKQKTRKKDEQTCKKLTKTAKLKHFKIKHANHRAISRKSAYKTKHVQMYLNFKQKQKC